MKRVGKKANRAQLNGKDHFFVWLWRFMLSFVLKIKYQNEIQIESHTTTKLFVQWVQTKHSIDNILYDSGLKGWLFNIFCDARISSLSIHSEVF